MKTKSELANITYKDIASNKKAKILKVYKGKEAVQKIKNLFFGDDTKKASNWANNWNNYEKSQSIFIIYSYQKIKNKDIHFKFIIGDELDGSVLGERHTYKKGMEIMKNI
jgi:hypothetical protein